MSNTVTGNTYIPAPIVGQQCVPGITPRAGKLHIVLINPAAVAATITVFDSAQASSSGAGAGNILANVTATTTSGALAIDFIGRVDFHLGLYAVVAGAGATANVTFE